MSEEQKLIRRDLGKLKTFLDEWELRSTVEKVVQRLVTGTEASLLRSLIDSIELRENGYPKSRAGLFFYRSGIMELHSEILKPGREQDRNSTTLHELAHAVAFFTSNHKGHGGPWIYIMDLMGLPPIRCHTLAYLDFDRRRGQVRKYKCEKCQVVLTRSRKGGLDKGIYYHGHGCGGRIHPLELPGGSEEKQAKALATGSHELEKDGVPN